MEGEDAIRIIYCHMEVDVRSGTIGIAQIRSTDSQWVGNQNALYYEVRGPNLKLLLAFPCQTYKSFSVEGAKKIPMETKKGS